MIEDNIRRKIEELIARSVSLVTHTVARDIHYFARCNGWITGATNVIQLAIPAPNNAYRVSIEKTEGGNARLCVASC
jgi:hypothetical protein